MATPRKRLVSSQEPMFYHLTSRCVRKSHLCGKRGGRDFSHRKNWLIQRMQQLGQAFALEVHAFAITSNHFHLVVYYDPNEAESWSDDEVANRWLTACPPRLRSNKTDPQRLFNAKTELLSNNQRLLKARAQLGSMSTFMQMLKQPIARRANIEDDCEGHFFDQRYYSGALLSEEAILAAMAYVDLNPIRAKIAKTLEKSEFTSLAARLKTHELQLPMRPIVSGLIKPRFVIKVILADYLTRVESISGKVTNAKLARWRQQVAMIRMKQRAFGSMKQLKFWTSERKMQFREMPLP